MKIGMISLGCPKNLTDAETMLALLDGDGHKIVVEPKDADVIIVNTCGFIESAKEESINTTLEMAEFKKDKCKLLIMTGCLAERYNTQIVDQLPEVDAIVGTGDYHKIAEVINAAIAGERVMLYGHIDFTPEVQAMRKLATGTNSAYLKISDGCDNRCTYCAIPSIRGRYRSRKMEDVVNEAKNLAKQGIKEIILIAQDTTRYGIDLYGEYSLARLLKELCKIDAIEWVRVHYFYTEAITDELIETIATEEKITKYIDMPIQHASDNILKKMARRSNKMQIKSIIEKLRAKIPDVCIRTSIIVGFPTETENDFEELYNFVENTRFDRVGVFSYSQEENTPAAEFDGQIDEDIKQERNEKLMSLAQKISFEKNKEKLGKTLKVITEGYDEACFMYFGRSEFDSIDIDNKVYFASSREVEIGEFVFVKVLDCDEYDLTGEMIN